MKLQTKISRDGYEIEVTGEYIPAESGSRDRFGVPLEPDYDAYFDVINIDIAGISYDIDQLAELLECSVDYIDEVIQEALQREYESDLEYYHELQAENHREYYDYF
jgi:hypothetical protein